MFKTNNKIKQAKYLITAIKAIIIIILLLLFVVCTQLYSILSSVFI